MRSGRREVGALVLVVVAVALAFVAADGGDRGRAGPSGTEEWAEEADNSLPPLPPPGESGRGCSNLAGAQLPDLGREGNCWWLLVNEGRYFAYFLSGSDPDDPSRGVLHVLSYFDLTGQTFRLPPGTAPAYIYEVTLEAVCLTTADRRAFALDLGGGRIVPAEEAPSCPEPRFYEVGEAFRVDCTETPDSGPFKPTDDCWALALSEQKLAFFIGTVIGTTEVGYLCVFGTARDGGCVSDDIEVPGGGDLTIYHVSLERVCFTTERAGPGGYDLTANRLVPQGEPTGCPAPPT